ncbi:hypothetical protein STAFG_6184 [Streptomyces afghaniensis 772]|uniref:Uncharacterized protein n=1 Tax=Streptomyces afghaniensis 772 TaxID=1283301 RepID=S4MT10_9ACTN|nr:hypothetical protein STAFG_6184 [Streptomyces afghaniensis 772]
MAGASLRGVKVSESRPAPRTAPHALRGVKIG